MPDDRDIFTEGFKQQPYWWDAAPRPRFPARELPRQVDVAVIGSGHTGLVAALTLARAGRHVALFEAGDPGQGASSRNAGYVGRTLKHGFGKLMSLHGLERAKAVYRDARAAFDLVFEIVEQEQINCRLARNGRLIGAPMASHYEALARELELKRQHLGDAYEMVPKSEMRREIGSDFYAGGAVLPDHGSLHPGVYNLGLLDRAIGAGVVILVNTAVTGIAPGAAGVIIQTARGAVRARNVLVATNGYVDGATPWLKRRLIPIHGYMVATEQLAPETLARVSPNSRTFIDFNNNVFFMRRSPDGERILFGGDTGGPARDLKAKARRLHAAMGERLPDLKDVKLSHVWTGQCAATFDLYPHIGVHDGVHYALGYSFAGLPMGTFLGRQAARKIMGDSGASTVFDELPFKSHPLYTGNPWFVPMMMQWYDWKDRRGL
ncbi:MAG: NAD(P)/FAD-dependent oxidoreductase [Dongiaceae bacterium]